MRKDFSNRKRGFVKKKFISKVDEPQKYASRSKKKFREKSKKDTRIFREKTTTMMTKTRDID